MKSAQHHVEDSKLNYTNRVYKDNFHSSKQSPIKLAVALP